MRYLDADGVRGRGERKMDCGEILGFVWVRGSIYGGERAWGETDGPVLVLGAGDGPRFPPPS